MAVKILGGSLKGETLHVNERVTRPTGVLLKRKIFDSRQFFEGKVFIDLCSGSGSVGVEAHSRGADKVILVESNKLALRDLKNSLEILRKNKGRDLSALSIIQGDAYVWLKNLFAQNGDFSNTIIFFDPPYNATSLYLDVVNLIQKEKAKFNGELWVEYDLKGSDEVNNSLDLLYKEHGIKYYVHGQHRISMFDFT